MQRMFAVIVKHPMIVKKILSEDRILLKFDKNKNSDGWGIGFFQKGEGLLKKRPVEDCVGVDLAEVIEDLETEIMLGHIRNATLGNPSNENTHPFRSRGWLFIHNGTLNNFDKIKDQLREMIPPFLYRNIKGDTDSEHIFHLILAYLHDCSKLDKPNIKPEEIATAAKETIKLLVEFGNKNGIDNIGNINFIMSNGNYLVATRYGELPLYKMSLDNIKSSLPVTNQAIIIASKDLIVGPHWEEISDRSVFVFDSNLNSYSTKIEI